MLKLVVTEKGGESKQLVFDKDEISIGRVQGNDIVLPKGNISKRHSKIAFKDGRFLVLDQKSTNGTYVNGKKIADATTVTGADKIYVGDFIITLDGSDGDAAAPAPGRRAPPPPPPSRGASGPSKAPPVPRAAKSTLDDDEDALGNMEVAGASGPTAPGRPGARPAPPPPPLPRRESGADASALPDVGSGDGGPPSPDDLDDEEVLATAPPRRPAPPLRPVPSISSDDDDDAGRVVTGSRPRAPVPAPAASTPVPEVSGEAPPAPGSLDDLLADPEVTAIFISGPDAVHAERGSRVESTGLSFGDSATLTETIRAIAANATPIGPPDDGTVVDVRLADGSRMTAILPPAAVTGACASIRKPLRQSRSLADLAGAGCISKEMQQLLEACVAARRNIIVSGDLAAALALTGALAASFRDTSRVASVGGGVEISLPLAGWVDLSGDTGGRGVIRAASALRSDYLLVTAVGGAEIADLLQVGALGQEGIICTLSARSAGEAAARMEALALQASGAAGAREIIASTFDVVVNAATVGDGSLRVTEVADLKLSGDKLSAEAILTWRADPSGADGRPNGRFGASGATPRVAAALASRGAPVPATLFRKA